MYYPYLNGGTHELRAVRDFCETLAGVVPHVCPIIEPNQTIISSISRTISSLSRVGAHCYIILNPPYTELKNEKYIKLRDTCSPQYSISSCCCPAYIVNNIDEIKADIADKGYNGVMLIVSKGTSIDDDKFRELVSLQTIDKVVVSPASKSAMKIAKDAGKDVILLGDKISAHDFTQSSRCDEEFSQDVFYFESEGYAGFSDYTALPDGFGEDDGAVPNTVILHLTYQKSADKINVRHFCSTIETEYKSHMREKFMEAITGAVAFFGGRTEAGSAIRALDDCVKNNWLRGMGTVRRWCILHHLELMQKLLSTK